MAIVNGTNLRVYWGGIPFGHATNCTLSFDVEMIELAPTSLSDKEWRRGEPRKLSATINVSALHQIAGSNKAWYNVFVAATGFTSISFAFQDAQHTYSGTGYIQSGQLTGPVAQNAAYSITIFITGEMTVAGT